MEAKWPRHKNNALRVNPPHLKSVCNAQEHKKQKLGETSKLR